MHRRQLRRLRLEGHDGEVLASCGTSGQTVVSRGNTGRRGVDYIQWTVQDAEINAPARQSTTPCRLVVATDSPK